MTNETITEIEAIDLSVEDWENTENLTGKVGILFCTTAGDVTVETPKGNTTTKAMVAGEYWRFSPRKVIRATTTATVELHL